VLLLLQPETNEIKIRRIGSQGNRHLVRIGTIVRSFAHSTNVRGEGVDIPVVLCEKMDIRRHFFEYTLTAPQIQSAVAIFSFIFTAVGILGVTVFKNDKRKMAWTISLLNSFVLTIAGGAYFISHIPAFVSNGRAAFHAVDDAAVLISLWLCLGNIFDLVFGLTFYRSHLDPLTAYVHHTLYVWITIVGAFGTDGFQKYDAFAGGLASLMIEEFPTFLLAVGTVFPSLRTDMGFGGSFFLFRVLFHAAMMAYSYCSGVSPLVKGLYVVTMTMHLFWFTSWVRKYGKKSIVKSKESREPEVRGDKEKAM
jgi:hypothetical protein